MYELRSYTVTEPMLREIRRQELPSQQHRRVHGHALLFANTGPSSGFSQPTTISSGSWTLTRFADALRRRRGLAVDVS
jgi:hypothetical protein